MRVAKTPFRFVLSLAASLVVALGAAYSAAAPAPTAPLRIAYSDWPGWVAWQVAIDKGWLKEAGVNAQFEWFDYVPSMDAFSAGKVDAVTMTNGDALVTGAAGAKSVMILITDYSNGNDMIVARPQYKSLQDLKGQKIGLEVGFVEHLLLLNGLEKVGMKESDIELVNVKTNETPQVLASGQVAAIGAWQPNSGAAMKAVPGARPIYTSAQAPGLIYDVVAVNPNSLATRRADWAKLVMVWDRVVKYINDPRTVDDAVKIMAARVGVSPETYKPMLVGTKFLTLEEGKKVYVKAAGLGSLYGSTKIAEDFNIKYDVYKEAQNVDSYIDASLTNGK
ncbi:MAG: ABC transporter substrate-binding protein [Hyphomicrobium sp.]|nr:ABC transporter substrate-binding protein [Hyphomicrobium sp.]